MSLWPLFCEQQLKFSWVLQQANYINTPSGLSLKDYKKMERYFSVSLLPENLMMGQIPFHSIVYTIVHHV